MCGYKVGFHYVLDVVQSCIALKCVCVVIIVFSVPLYPTYRTQLMPMDSPLISDMKDYVSKQPTL